MRGNGDLYLRVDTRAAIDPGCVMVNCTGESTIIVLKHDLYEGRKEIFYLTHLIYGYMTSD